MSTLEQGIEQLGRTAKRIADERNELRATLRELRAWIKSKLEYAPRKHMEPEPTYPPGPGHPHGWCAVCVPDWDMRQKLDLIEEALAPPQPVVALIEADRPDEPDYEPPPRIACNSAMCALVGFHVTGCAAFQAPTHTTEAS